MKHTLFISLLLSSTAGLYAQNTNDTPAPGTEFQYPTEGNSISYVILDETTCQTKPGQWAHPDNSHIQIEFGNSVQGELVIPETVTYQDKQYTVVKIGAVGFEGVTSVTLPSTLKTIGDYAFAYNKELTSVAIPESVDSIGGYAFIYCSGLVSAILPSTLTTIPSHLFYRCDALSTIELPATLTSIGDFGFCHTALTSVTIPNAVTAIGANAFQACPIANINLGEGVQTIGAQAFSGCSSILSVTLPPSVTQLGEQAFNSCSKLSEVICQATTPPSISTNTFGSNTLAGTLKVYKTALPQYTGSATWGKFSKKEMIEVAATDITLNKAILTVYDGISSTLTTTLQPADATTQVVWSSSNDDMVAVTQQGKITGHRIGTATITATAGNYSAQCEVTVLVNPDESVTITKLSGTLYVGDEVQMQATVKPVSVTAPVTWMSSNPDIASIDETTGLLTANAPGGTVISALCNGVAGKLAITVEPVEATQVVLQPSTATLQVGQSTTLIASVVPQNATYRDILWSTNDETVAVVANGEVTATGIGTATITAACGNISAVSVITVEPTPAEKIELSNTEATLFVGQNIHLLATVTPDNATDKTVIWTIDSEDIATVAQDGTVTAVKPGTAMVTATCGTLSATCTVNVQAIEATEIFLDYSALTLYIGQEQQLTVSVGDEVTDKTVTWTSSNASVAIVSAAGVITAVAEGTTTVTATCGKATAQCEVTVLPIAVETVTLDTSSATLNVGEEITLTATVTPDNATDKTTSWTSANNEIATVDANGKVTAAAPGTTVITVSAGLQSATCTVTVLSPATSISLNVTEITLSVGSMIDLIETVEPSNTTDVVEWTTADNAIASVDINGIVEALAPGKTTITATCGTVSATCEITVEPVDANDITLDMNSINIDAGATQQITATFGANLDATAAQWTSDNTLVATVDNNGLVTGVAPGTAIVTVTCGSATAQCEVTVAEVPVTAISLDYTTLTLQAGDTQQLTLTVTPTNATDKSATWKSLDEKVATVDNSGVVTAVAGGETLINVECGGFYASCSVTVWTPLQSITLNKTELELTVGASEQLTATLNPADTGDTVEWSSDNEQVAFVSINGLVEGISEGTTTITASAADITATCTVTVKKKNDNSSGVETIKADNQGHYNVYNLSGVHVLTTTSLDAVNNLTPGFYIVNGTKVYIR